MRLLELPVGTLVMMLRELSEWKKEKDKLDNTYLKESYIAHTKGE